MKFFTNFALTWALSLLVIVQAHEWEARYRLTHTQFQTAFDSFSKQGYRLNYVSGYTIGDDPRYAGIWEKKSSHDWVAKINLTSSQYQDAFNSYVNAKAGYRLVLVNGYTVKGRDRYVAIWDKSPSGLWIARHGLTSDQYQSLFDSYSKQGYKLKHVSGYAIDNQPRYAAIWEKSDDKTPWVARHGLSPAEFAKQYEIYVSQGYRLTDISGYGVGKQEFYAAIWEKKSGKPWLARWGLTPELYASEFSKYSKDYILKILDGYTVDGKDKYATLWEKE